MIDELVECLIERERGCSMIIMSELFGTSTPAMSKYPCLRHICTVAVRPCTDVVKSYIYAHFSVKERFITL